MHNARPNRRTRRLRRLPRPNEGKLTCSPEEYAKVKASKLIEMTATDNLPADLRKATFNTEGNFYGPDLYYAWAQQPIRKEEILAQMRIYSKEAYLEVLAIYKGEKK